MTFSVPFWGIPTMENPVVAGREALALKALHRTDFFSVQQLLSKNCDANMLFL